MISGDSPRGPPVNTSASRTFFCLSRANCFSSNASPFSAITSPVFGSATSAARVGFWLQSRRITRSSYEPRTGMNAALENTSKVSTPARTSRSTSSSVTSSVRRARNASAASYASTDSIPAALKRRSRVSSRSSPV